MYKKIIFNLISLVRYFRANLSFFYNKKNKIDEKEKEILENLSKIAKSKKKFNLNDRVSSHNLFSKKVLDIVIDRKLTNFIRFGFIQQMLFVHNRIYILFYLRELLQDKFNWNYLLRETNIGSPIKYFLYPKTSGNQIFTLYHLRSFKEFLKNEIDNFDNIFEFGAGFGAMTLNFYKINKKSNFILYDTFELTLLQYYFLIKNSLDAVILNNSIEKKQFQLISDMHLLKKSITTIDPEHKNLFIANWSISEIPLPLRHELLILLKKFDYKFITFNNMYADIDNIEFFNKLKLDEEEKGNMCIIKPIKFHKNNYYFFSKPNN